MADCIRVMEHSTLKVPYEVLNKKFRSAQKTIDREVAHLSTASADLEKLLECHSTPLEKVVSMIDTVVDKLNVLKRKAAEAVGDELEAAQICKRRLEHLKEFEVLSPAAQAAWKKTRLDRMLVEHCLRMGYYSTAISLANHADIKELTNVDIFVQSKQIEESLMACQTGPCLAWCHENKSKLRKAKSTLEFDVRQQEVVELIRQGRKLEAVKHARRHLAVALSGGGPLTEPEHIRAMQKIMGLLAFPSDSLPPSYKELLDPNRWKTLVEQFRQENISLYQLSSCSVFLVTLQCGLSALKTPFSLCYKERSKNNNCPVCSRHLNEIARLLPFSHSVNSRLICPVTGEPLNEHNPPLMLPNGHVYGANALLSLADQNEGKIVCPRTKETFTKEQLEKVFIM